MTNGADEPSDRVQFASSDEQGQVPGRSVVVQIGSDSGSGSQGLDQESLDTTAADEWDSYIDTQKRDGWSDLDYAKQAFCDEYLSNGYNHREAAVSVDFPVHRGKKLLNDPLCREYIVEAEQARRNRSLVTERFLEAQYFQLLDQANGDEEVAIVTGSGAQLNAKKFDGNLKHAVLKELGAISGVTKPDAAALGGVTVIIDMGALTGADHKPKVISEQ